VEVDSQGSVKSENVVDIGEVPPNSALLKTTFTLQPGVSNAAFNIFFSARNGHFAQMLRLVQVDGKWSSATKVLDPVSGRVFYEQIPTGFPVTANTWQ